MICPFRFLRPDSASDSQRSGRNAVLPCPLPVSGTESAKHQAGFTLLEIVTTMFLLGALAFPALTRYLDLGDAAFRHAAVAAVNEAQIRIDAKFAENLKKGMSCSEASADAANLGSTLMKASHGFVLQTITLLPEDETVRSREDGGTAVTVEVLGRSSAVENAGTLYAPSCSDEELKAELPPSEPMRPEQSVPGS